MRGLSSLRAAFASDDSQAPRTLLVSGERAELTGEYVEEREGSRYRRGGTVLWSYPPYWLFTSEAVAATSGFPAWWSATAMGAA